MIPCDYAGVMGVPITIMEHYNPDQFEIRTRRISREKWTAAEACGSPNCFFYFCCVVSVLVI